MATSVFQAGGRSARPRPDFVPCGPGSVAAASWTAVTCVVLLPCLALFAPLAAQPAQPDPPSQSSQSDPSEPRAVGTMSELMVRILYPYSDAVFYITTRAPTNEEEWLELEGKTLMLAETANLLMMAGRSWGGEERAEEWRRDAKLLLDAGEAAYEATKARDVDALAGLNDQLYESCVRCHADFRPDYGRR